MTDFIEEIAKQLPIKQIYDDVAQPSAKQVGTISEDLLRTLHLVLAPIQITSALQDRFRNFVNKSIRKIPEENRIQPPPQIAGPVLEGIKYEPEGTPIDEMFSRILG